MPPCFYFSHFLPTHQDPDAAQRGRRKINPLAEFLKVRCEISQEMRPIASVFRITGGRHAQFSAKTICRCHLWAQSPSAVAMSLFIAHAMPRLEKRLDPDQIYVHGRQANKWCSVVGGLMNQVALPVEITRSAVPNPDYALLHVSFDQSTQPSHAKAVFWYGIACGIFQRAVDAKNLDSTYALPTVRDLEVMHSQGIQGLFLPVISPPPLSVSQWLFNF